MLSGGLGRTKERRRFLFFKRPGIQLGSAALSGESTFSGISNLNALWWRVGSARGVRSLKRLWERFRERFWEMLGKEGRGNGFVSEWRKGGLLRVEMCGFWTFASDS